MTYWNNRSKYLVKAKNSGGSNYDWTFDDNSNILKYTTGTDDHNYEIEANKNQLKKILSSTTSFERNFFYDENGDTTGIRDANNLLLHIVYNTTNGKARTIYNEVTNKEATFDYGPNQSRIRKRVTNNGTPVFTSTFPIPGVEVMEDGTTTQTKTYIGTQGMGLVYHKEDQKFHWIIPDNLGSTRMIVDEEGAPEWVFNYDVYGSPTATSYNNPTMTFNNLFTGQYWDGELGLYNYHARFYDPALARFLQVDPAHQGFSPYTYVGGMPNIMTDPTGKIAGTPLFFGFLSIISIVAAIGMAIIGGVASAFGDSRIEDQSLFISQTMTIAAIGFAIAAVGSAIGSTALTGGGLGFAIGGMVNGFSNVSSVNDHNYGKKSASLWASSAIGGAVAASAAYAGVSVGNGWGSFALSIGRQAVIGAVGGATNSVVSQSINNAGTGRSINWEAVAESAGIGAGVAGGAGLLIGAVQGITSSIVNYISSGLTAAENELEGAVANEIQAEENLVNAEREADSFLPDDHPASIRLREATEELEPYKRNRDTRLGRYTTAIRRFSEYEYTSTQARNYVSTPELEVGEEGYNILRGMRRRFITNEMIYKFAPEGIFTQAEINNAFPWSQVLYLPGSVTSKNIASWIWKNNI